MKNVEKCEIWYNENNYKYNSCGVTLKSLIETILKRKGVLFHSIEYRIKSKESFLEKCKKDKYVDPINEITDVCGIRIIGYTNHDVKLIQEIIESEFKIDKDNSIDKSEIMKDDQVGYRSVHYVASIKSNRTRLMEYQEYQGIKFEIQIRTLLQHAWAEIEHDRNYKFSGELPSEIKRRFYLVAGSLELLDREFEQLSQDIDTYAEKIRTDAGKGELNEKINSTSLLEYLSIKLKDYDIENRDFNGADKKIILELSLFGVNSLKDLDELLSNGTIKRIEYPYGIQNYLGLLRDVMIATDAKNYFEKAWQGDWKVMGIAEYTQLLRICPDIENYKELFFLE